MEAKRLLIIHEGDTERLFYEKVVSDFVRKPKVIVKWKNARSESNLTFHSVLHWINRFLYEQSFATHLTVVIAYDREGNFDKPDKLNLPKIEKELNNKRLSSIHQIIATKQLESWFHYDAEGIYEYLAVPKKERKKNPHSNPHSLTSNDLNAFCKRHGKSYPKGKGDDAKAFLNHLNLDTIYTHCEEFRTGVDLLKKLLH